MSEVYVKFSPCLSKKDTIIEKLSDTTISIDGEEVGPFDLDGINWPNISKETAGAVSEAHRKDGDLYLVVTRFYSGSCSEWDTGDYHKMMSAEEEAIVASLVEQGVSETDATAAAAEVKEALS